MHAHFSPNSWGAPSATGSGFGFGGFGPTASGRNSVPASRTGARSAQSPSDEGPAPARPKSRSHSGRSRPDDMSTRFPTGAPATSRSGSQHGDLGHFVGRAEAVLDQPADVGQA